MPSARRSAPPELIRPGLLPSLVAAVALVVGLTVLESGLFLAVRFIVCILALVVVTFAVQARKWLWLIPLAAIAVVWNPAWPLEFEGTGWAATQILGAAAFLAVGAFLRTPERDRA